MSRRRVRSETSRRSASSPPPQKRRDCSSESSRSSRELVLAIPKVFHHSGQNLTANSHTVTSDDRRKGPLMTGSQHSTERDDLLETLGKHRYFLRFTARD